MHIFCTLIIFEGIGLKVIFASIFNNNLKLYQNEKYELSKDTR